MQRLWTYLFPADSAQPRRRLQATLGLFTDVGCQLIVTLSTFFLTPLVLACTSKSLYGSWQAALSILSYLAMLDAGLGFSLIRLVASAADKRGASGLSGVASTAFFSFSAIGGVLLAAGFCVASFVPVWFHVPAGEASSVIQAYRLAALAAAVGLPFATFGGILDGLQKKALFGVIRVVTAVVGATLSFTLLCCHLGIAALAIANLVGSSVGGLLALFAVFKFHPKLKISPKLVTRAELARLWNVAGYFQLVRIAYIIALNTDPLIIAAFLGVSEVTPYVITARMATMFSIVLADKAPSAAYPSLAQMYALGESQQLKRAYLALVYYSTRLALVGAILVALLNPQFVGLWVGSLGYGGATLNYVFVYWVLLDTILRGSSIIPLTTGDMKPWAVASIAEALLNAGASVLLVHWFGIVGVALGTALARTLVTGVFIPAWSCKKLGLAISDFFRLGVIGPAVGCAPGISVAVAVAFALPPSLGWFRLMLVGVTAVVSNVITFEGMRWLNRPTRTFRTLVAELLSPQLGLALKSNAAE